MAKTILTLCCLLSVLTQLTNAQTYKTDTLFIADAETANKKIYTDAIRNQSQLYNGSDFKLYVPLQDEHPYLFSDDWINGTVLYDDNFYENVPIQYDIQNDEVIIEYYNGIRSIKLTKLKVARFTLEQHQFVLIQDPQVTPGFYEILYDGNTKVFARYSKALQETISGREIQRDFKEKIRYYLLEAGNYHSISSKKSLLAVFQTRKKS